MRSGSLYETGNRVGKTSRVKDRLTWDCIRWGVPIAGHRKRGRLPDAAAFKVAGQVSTDEGIRVDERSTWDFMNWTKPVHRGGGSRGDELGPNMSGGEWSAQTFV